MQNNINSFLEKEIKILNKGFIRLIDYMGDDSAIAQAARVSYGKGTKTINNDIGLIRYLLKHQHTTPFEMCEIKLHIKAPIFVARQWLRHRTANVNEYSARYSMMEEDYYVPEIENVKQQSTSNKQGRDKSFPENDAKKIINTLESVCDNAFDNYNKLINYNVNNDDNEANTQEYGVAKELARVILPVNFYTQFYWKIDLHNLLHFLQLRVDSHAQYEIRAYAEQILNIVKAWVPISYQAFMDYKVNAKTFSATELNIIKRLLVGEKLDDIKHNLSNRELLEFKKTLELL